MLVSLIYVFMFWNETIIVSKTGIILARVDIIGENDIVEKYMDWIYLEIYESNEMILRCYKKIDSELC